MAVVGISETLAHNAKQNEYAKLDADYTHLNTALLPKLNSTDSSLNAVEAAKQKEMLAFNTLMNDGFLTRIEALHHLIQNNAAAQFRYYLLIIILVLIELMPVIAKSLLPDGTYDEKVRQREIMEKTIVSSNTEKERSLKELYNQLAFEQDGEFIQQFFEEAKQERKEKMLEKLKVWRQKEDGSFDSVWSNLKKDFLTKQEN